MTTENPFFLFYQRTPKSTWIAAPAADRDRIITEHNPPFITALDADNDFSTILTSEQQAAVRYRGAAFFDFDGELDEAIPQVQKFVGKLQAHDVSLAQCSLACTGNRGLHITIPQACFMPTVPQEGIASLPHVYKEMAYSLFCDTMDLRIYSSKKGRMLRTFGTKHDSTGLFKVAVTLDEVMSLTPEAYKTLCAAPRDLIKPEPPTLAKGLAALFAEARQKVAAVKAKRKRAPGKTAAALKARFIPRGAALPVSLLGLGAGQIPAREGAGFNQIALQLCATAIAMGTDEDTLVNLCSVLIRDHESDGTRYNSPRKRDIELRKMYRYVETSNYEVSIGGIKSILPQNARCNDLRGL